MIVLLQFPVECFERPSCCLLIEHLVLVLLTDSTSSPYANVDLASSDTISLGGGGGGGGGLGKETEFDRRKKKK